MGLDPRPFTLRQLSYMADGRRVEQWDHSAALLAQMINLVSKRQVLPRKLNPYRNRPEDLPTISAAQLGDLLGAPVRKKTHGQ